MNDDLLPEQEANCSRPVSAYYVQIIGEKTKKLVVVDNDSNHGAATLKRSSLSPTPGYFLPNDVEGDLPADFPDFSPLPYEYTIDSNTDGWTLTPQQHCGAAGNDTKKRQKTLENAWAKRCQQNSGITTLCLPNIPRPLNHVTCRREFYRTHDELPVHPHDGQSTIPHLKEEHKQQQHEYLSATLNFPYKDFIASHNKNDSHLQLWCDEEEQLRLEKHFNTKWQVEFFSKFYSGESQSLKTPVDDIFGPKPSSSSSEKELEKDNSSANARRSLSASTAQSEEDEEIVFVSMTSNTFKYSSANRHFPKEGRRTDHSNMSYNEICTSRSGSSADSSNILLEEAAIKLAAAMDDTDETRDLIASIEKEMQINRDEILKVRTAYVAHNRQDEEGR